MILIFYGILLISIGALMSGSFAIAFDKVRVWRWENYWLVFSLFAYIVIPLIISLIFVPDLLDVLSMVHTKTILWVALLGALYGAANITFGLSLRYLGLALGYALSLGLMMALGTLIPPMIDGRLAKLFQGSGGVILVCGIFVSLIGIGISAYAGYLKSRQSESSEGVNSEFDIKKGVAAALFVGITGSSAALGIEQGMPIARASVDFGTDPLFADSAVFLILYGGSFITTLIWCLYLSIKNRNISSFVSPVGKTLARNYLFCAIAGALWYINYVFFGMGKSKMGEFSFVAWGILMTLTIVFATIWGLYRGEWRGVCCKTRILMWIGLFVLIGASFLIGISSSV